MKKQKFTTGILAAAAQLAEQNAADALVLLIDHTADWDSIREEAGDFKIVVAVDAKEQAEGAKAAGIEAVVLDMADSPVIEKLTQSLLEAVADDFLNSGCEVVALYSGFDPARIDSFSYIRLDDHLGKLTARDLRQLETSVPLETLKTVVDLAVEIGREGREGKPVGTLFTVGDARKVKEASRPMGFDPMKGYSRKERGLTDARVRENIKEIAVMDGAFIVAADATVEAACRMLNAITENITLSKGLGSRHWAAAGITKKTNCVAIAVSESNGTVRVFQGGEVMLRIEPFRRAMKWKDFDFEGPTGGSGD